MKIKELTIKNIGPIRSSHIDFEKGLIDSNSGEPASLFLISGDTGAGKSILLDAISLALYKTTPRINGVANPTTNKYFISTGEEMKVNDITQYTRLGVSPDEKCFSEVVFEGNDRVEYRAKLDLGIYYQKKDKNGERKIAHHTPVWSVKKGKGDWVSKDVQTIIFNAVGLTFDQFNRMAMLAQGQFATFLTGSKEDREKILEQLTNTEKFSKYGEAIKDIFSDKKNALEKAQTAYETETAHIAGVDITALNTELKTYQEEKKTIEKEKLEVDTKLEIVKSVLAGKDEKTEAAVKKSELEDKQHGEDYMQKDSLVKDWDNSDSARINLGKLEGARTDMQSAEIALEAAKKTYETLIADFNYHNGVIADKEAECKNMESWLNERVELDSLYTDVNAVDGKLESYQAVLERLARLKGSLAGHTNNIAPLQSVLDAAKANTGKCAENVKAFEDAISELNNSRNALEPSKVNTDLTAATKKRGKAETLKTSLDALNTNIDKANDDARDIKTDEAALKTLDEKKEAAKSVLDKAVAASDAAKKFLNTMHMSVEDTLKSLRVKLHDENAEYCPLCGQRHTAWNAEDNFRTILKPLEDEEKRTAAARQTAQKAYDTAKGDHDTLNGTIAAKKKSLAKLIEQNNEDRAATEKSAQSLGLDTCKQLAPQVDTLLQTLKDMITELSGKQDQAEKIQTEITRQTEEKKPFDEQLLKARMAENDASAAVTDNKKDITRLTDDINTENGRKTGLETYLSPLLDSAYSDWKEHTDEVRKRLKADAGEYIIKKDSHSRIAQEISTEKVTVSTISVTRDKIVARVHVLPQVSDSKELASDNITVEWATVLSSFNTSLDKIKECKGTIGEITPALEEYYRKSGRSEQSLHELSSKSSEIASARKYVDGIKTEIAKCEANITTAEAKISDGLTKLGAEKIDDIPAKSELEERSATLQDRINGYIATIARINGQLDEYRQNSEKVNKAEEAFEAARKEFGRWKKINDIFGGTRFRTLVQTYILRPLLNNANIYLSQITDRYLLTCSEENQQLSIFVLDRYNKNEVRTATVLSGGEKFMISLALSLALSSLNRPDMNVNILFIDEGFGTLDQKSLYSVMQTLEKLQTIAGQTQRRVGIISHREELNDIPVQIQVTKKGESLSEVNIVSK